MQANGIPASGTATIDEVLEARGIGGAQVFIAFLCGLAVLLDGISTQIIGYIAPQMVRALHLGHEQIGNVFGAGLFGLLIGGLSCSFMADFAGRRTLLLISTLIFGVFTVATGFSDSLQELVAWRFLAGLGLGGAMPTAIALTAEVSPHRTRATMVMMMFCGFPLGGALAGVLAVAVLPVFGWQGVFITSGILALALMPILYLLLPESPVFLVNRRADPAKIAEVVARIAPEAANLTIIPPQGDEARGAPIASLFKEGRALGTVLLWVVYFMSLLDIFFMASWLPTVLHAGPPTSMSAVIATSMLQFGGVAGTLVLGRLLDRLSTYAGLGICYVGATIFIALIGVTPNGGGLIFAVLFAAGFFLIGGQSGLSALAASFYPTRGRASGVGWGLGIGRVGSIMGPIIGAQLVVNHWDMSSMFLLAAGATAVGAVAVAIMYAVRPKAETAYVQPIRIAN